MGERQGYTMKQVQGWGGGDSQRPGQRELNPTKEPAVSSSLTKGKGTGQFN